MAFSTIYTTIVATRIQQLRAALPDCDVSLGTENFHRAGWAHIVHRDTGRSDKVPLYSANWCRVADIGLNEVQLICEALMCPEHPPQKFIANF